MDEINWTLYNTRLNIDGSTYRDRNINRLKQSILDKAPDSISYKTVKINNVDANLMIIDTEQPTIKKIKSMPDETFMSGNYVDYANGKWLVVKSDFDDEVYTDGEMSQCSLLLKWQNSNGQIITRHAVVEKPITTSLDEGTIITTSQKRYSIKLPFDTETQNLFIDKRFLISIVNGKPQAYKVIDVDAVSGIYSGVGILNLTLEADVYKSEIDNAELMIADYFSPTPEPTGQAQITHSGNPTMYMGGSYKTFTGVFVDSEGVVLPDVIPVWTWVSLSSQTDKFNVVVDGSTFKIQALFDTSLIGTKVKIIIDDSLGLYHAEIIAEVISL